jgi:hypothetical protein
VFSQNLGVSGLKIQLLVQLCCAANGNAASRYSNLISRSVIIVVGSPASGMDVLMVIGNLKVIVS